MNDRYYSNVNPDILKYMPLDPSITILEIGCGAGALGAAYKQRNPTARYIGVEVSAEAAELARRHVDRIICGNVETLKLHEVLAVEGKIDCIVYGDVLEHLWDPWKLLQEHATMLTETGQVLACIPNVQNWRIICRLFAGYWARDEKGIQDKTHIRFFTVDDIVNMFIQSGLQIHELIPRIYDEPPNSKIYETLLMTTHELGIQDHPLQKLKFAASQFVVRAAKKATTQPVLLHSLLGETLVCSRVRISEPHSFCETIPGVKAVEDTGHVEKWPPIRENENRVFFWQRVAPDSFQQQELLLKRNYLIISEFDDHPMIAPKAFSYNDFEAFRSCHAIQVSTEPLADLFRQFNPHVAVFQNQIAVLPPPREYGQGPVRLFFGALNREEDWPELIPYINQCLQGVPHEVIVVHDRKFYEALSTKNKRFTPVCPFPQYQKLLAQADIAILPLKDTPFNRMKSDLKFLECAANGVVALASPVVYAQTIQDGETGLIYYSPNDFGEKLSGLLQDASTRRKIASQAYQWVKENRMLCMHFKKRLEWYRDLREQYDVLTEEIYQRVNRQIPK